MSGMFQLVIFLRSKPSDLYLCERLRSKPDIAVQKAGVNTSKSKSAFLDSTLKEMALPPTCAAKLICNHQMDEITALVLQKFHESGIVKPY